MLIRNLGVTLRRMEKWNTAAQLGETPEVPTTEEEFKEHINKRCDKEQNATIQDFLKKRFPMNRQSRQPIATAQIFASSNAQHNDPRIVKRMLGGSRKITVFEMELGGVSELPKILQKPQS